MIYDNFFLDIAFHGFKNPDRRMQGRNSRFVIDDIGVPGEITQLQVSFLGYDVLLQELFMYVGIVVVIR